MDDYSNKVAGIRMTDTKMADTWATDTEFYARVLKFLCIGGLSAGLPFSIYHAFWGDPRILIVLLPVLCGQALSLRLVLRHGFNPVSANVLALVQVGAVVTYIYFSGTAATYWLFASAVANFYIVRWGPALVYNTAAMTFVALLLQDQPEHLVRLLFSYVLVNIFVYAYSRHLDRRTREVNELLYHDTLTGAGNRMALEEALSRSQSHYRRYQTPASLLMIDLDHYKKVNDDFGHSVGDKVLKAFADTVRERLRETDSLYRFGGEEFIVIAENSSIDEAAQLAESLRQRIAEQGFPPTAGITVSVGLAELQTDETIDDWLRRADQALYQAKSAGRNRIHNQISNRVDAAAMPPAATPA